jgi:hypothetical protein
MQATQPYASNILPGGGWCGGQISPTIDLTVGHLQAAYPLLAIPSEKARVQAVPRAFFALAAALLALASPLVSGASVRPSIGTGVKTPAVATITLRGRTGIEGRWRSLLRLKLVRSGVPTSFSLCGVWGDPPKLSPECDATPGERLPEGSTMRLEQSRKLVNGVWKRVGQSAGPAVDAVLSNGVAGNRLGTVYYRVTLRQAPSGTVLRTSNTFKVTWYK